MSTTNNIEARSAEWKRFLAVFSSGLLTFLTLSGLSIYLLGFSETNQVLVLVHTILGILFIVPFLWYQVRHYLLYRRQTMTHVKLTGYLALGAAFVAVVSGVFLTVEAAFLTRIVYFWRLIHIVSTFALIISVLPHIVAIALRIFKADKQEAVAPVRASIRTFTRGTAVWTILLFAIGAAWALLYRPVQLDNQLPEDYNFIFGEERPFAPSLARTTTGSAFDARSLGGSKSCGVDGCHSEIKEEWEVSAHRWSAMDPAFRAVQDIMGQQNGAESTRYCGGCHDPISLFSGTKNLFVEDLTNIVGYDEGVSCIVCHGIKETDVQGNANYVLAQPQRYMYELSDGPTAEFASNFLIRAYPKKHIESLQHTLFKSPEFCGACHKQFVDEEVNNVGWVQLQNQYDNWKNSRWNHPGDPSKTIECRECHMPLVDSFDPSSGDDLDYNRSADDGKHRSHRFLGANQFMPTQLDLPGGDEQVALVESWLRGEFDVPEIADKWMEGPAAPIELRVPDHVRPGEEVEIGVMITNNKLGHDFPTGPLDIIQAWVEVEVTDDAGNMIFHSGMRDENHFVEPGTFMFKVEPVDQYGNLIDRHNLWEMVGVRYRKALFPGFSDEARYTFKCPSSLTGPGAPLPAEQTVAVQLPRNGPSKLNVRARLMYRKVDQYMLNVLFGPDSGLTSPVTLLSEAEKEIVLGP